LFTGSYEVGVKLQQETLHHHWKILALEMGGKNASVVWEDADLEKAVYECLVGSFLTAGQRCSCTSRIVLHKNIRDQFMDNFYEAREHANKLQMSQMLLDQEVISQESLYNQLVNRLTEQITSLESTNQALQNAQRRLISDSEEERKALAREIHDQIIQDMLSTNYQLEELATKHSKADDMQDQLFMIREGIRSMIDELRNICGTLRPPTIDSLGLNAAIQSFAQEWSKRSGVKVNLDLDPEIGRITEAIELSIYRIVQESLSNIHKHSSASLAKITLKRVSPRAIMLSVEDNGEGIDTDIDLSSYSKDGHFGMVGIEERVALLGGRLRVQNQSEGGLLIQAEIPHPRNETNNLAQ